MSVITGLITEIRHLTLLIGICFIYGRRKWCAKKAITELAAVGRDAEVRVDGASDSGF
jgi:hypothetical protein